LGDLDTYAYTADAKQNGVEQDIASIAAATPYTTQTYVAEIDINRLKQINLTAKMTGANASAVGPVDFYILLYDDPNNVPTKESFIMRVVVTGNTAQKTPQSFVVNHHYMKILKVVNVDASYAITNVNLLVTSNG
jgi:hypothetical protein